MEPATSIRKLFLLTGLLCLSLVVVGCGGPPKQTQLYTTSAPLDWYGLNVDPGSKAIFFDFVIASDSMNQGSAGVRDTSIASYQPYSLREVQAFEKMAADYLGQRYLAFSDDAGQSIRINAQPYQIVDVRPGRLSEDQVPSMPKIDGVKFSGPDKGAPIWTARVRVNVRIELLRGDRVVADDTITRNFTAWSRTPESEEHLDIYQTDLVAKTINHANGTLLLELHKTLSRHDF